MILIDFVENLFFFSVYPLGSGSIWTFSGSRIRNTDLKHLISTFLVCIEPFEDKRQKHVFFTNVERHTVFFLFKKQF